MGAGTDADLKTYTEPNYISLLFSSNSGLSCQSLSSHLLASTVAPYYGLECVPQKYMLKT